MIERHQPTPAGFEFTKSEKLYDKISEKRFQQLVFDTQTTIHEVKIDSNSYGEFVFVTASREGTTGRDIYTFWGEGFHELRERMITGEWRYYRAVLRPDTLQKQLSHADAQRLIDDYKAELKRDEKPQSQMGALFEILAELTDDDGAMSELDDLRYLGLLADDDFTESDD